jgi:hypothetical protein
MPSRYSTPSTLLDEGAWFKLTKDWQVVNYLLSDLPGSWVLMRSLHVSFTGTGRPRLTDFRAGGCNGNELRTVSGKCNLIVEGYSWLVALLQRWGGDFVKFGKIAECFILTTVIPYDI